MKFPIRFIVVDDDPTNNLLCSFAIRRCFPAIDIMLFEKPEVALEFIKEEYSSIEKDTSTVLFLDINMPVLTGWEFLEIFKDYSTHVHKQFSIYIISSSVDTRDKEKADLNPIVLDYISKPVSSDWVKETFTDSATSTQA